MRLCHRLWKGCWVRSYHEPQHPWTTTMGWVNQQHKWTYMYTLMHARMGFYGQASIFPASTIPKRECAMACSKASEFTAMEWTSASMTHHNLLRKPTLTPHLKALPKHRQTLAVKNIYLHKYKWALCNVLVTRSGCTNGIHFCEYEYNYTYTCIGSFSFVQPQQF